MTPKSPLNFEKFENKSFVLRLVIPKKEIIQASLDQLQKAQKTYELKGFRQGKVPLDIISQNIPQDELLEKAIPDLISHLYQQTVKDHHLRPIISPKVKVTNPPLSSDKDCEIEITSTELPDIKLDPAYTVKIKKLKPDKNNPNSPASEIFKTLIESSTVNLPPILIETEMENRLSQLIDELQKVHLSVEQYLKSKQLTPKQFEEALTKNITQEWQLNLAINQVATNEHIEIEKTEIEKLIKQNPNLAQDPYLVHHYLLQQKVIEFLKKLIL